MHGKIIALTIVVLIFVGLAATWYMNENKKAPVVTNEAPVVLSFEDCEAAGYPVMESSPRQCATPDGRTYTEELPAPDPVYVNADANMIRVELPFPGAVVGKEITVIGAARGNWFFEASFPIEVVDANGAIIARGIGEPRNGAGWMTTEFVPFESTITVPATFTGTATLVLKNDNPSGMPENDRSISFPITIEY